MQLINRALAVVGTKLTRTERLPWASIRDYQTQLRRIRSDPPARFPTVVEYFEHDPNEHPVSFSDWECSFCASHLQRLRPATILDVGSYSGFVIGLLAHYSVTTVDVRGRPALAPNETVITCDAKRLTLPDSSFDAVTSLCAVEHFGLGRYGDELDFDADVKAIREFVRVLKPGGRLIFTTTIRNDRPVLAFNAHRVYTRRLLEELLSPLSCEDEAVFDLGRSRFSDMEQWSTKPTDGPKAFDIYCGCWRKDD